MVDLEKYQVVLEVWNPQARKFEKVEDMELKNLLKGKDLETEQAWLTIGTEIFSMIMEAEAQEE